MAWQFDRPDPSASLRAGPGEGVVQAFRRADSPYESARFQLHGLDPEARYTVTNLDVPGRTEATGRELMEQGLRVVLEERPGAAIVIYQRMRDEG
jgi:alpha-galactosidase